MTKPLIVQAIPNLGGGGAEREVARVSRVLNDEGTFEIVVCCLTGRGVFADIVEQAGVEVAVLKERGRPSPLDMLKFLRRRKPAIVHSHLLRWGPTVAKLAGVPAVVMSEHGWSPPRGRLGVLFDRANIHFADRVVAVSEATRKIRMEKWRTPADKVITIPNVVDTGDVRGTVDAGSKKEEIGIPPGAPVVGIVGRLIPIKSQHYFVEAAAEILKVRPECEFLVVGDGPSRADLEAQAAGLEISDRVHFLGFREDAREIMQVMDVVCLSSLSEGTPITILEAMACSKPAVVTGVGGCPEVVEDGVNGFVVPPRDPEALAAAILKLVADHGLARRMGDAGLLRVQTDYSVEKNLALLLNLYRELISRSESAKTDCRW